MFETAGVCTRFPHPSQLYRTLLAKDWQPTLCLVPKFMIPPTVTVNRATIAASPARAATLTVDALAAVRACRYKKKGEEPPKPPEPVQGFNEYGFVKPVECWPVDSEHCKAAKAAGAKSKGD